VDTGIASYVKVAASTEDDVVLGALVAALYFAADLGTATVRVFRAPQPNPGRTIAYRSCWNLAKRWMPAPPVV
jgi:hypothetical protein